MLGTFNNSYKNNWMNCINEDGSCSKIRRKTVSLQTELKTSEKIMIFVDHKLSKVSSLSSWYWSNFCWIRLSTSFFFTFPGTPFPRNFHSTCKKILTRLHRVFIHVYIHHFDRVSSMGAEAHINACYKHFFYFVRNFHLVSEQELKPLVSEII